MLKYIYEKLLEDSIRLFVLDLQHDIAYQIDKDFLTASEEYIFTNPINISKWCAEYCEEYVSENDTKSFVDLVNPYVLSNKCFTSTQKPKEQDNSLLFMNRKNEWRYATVQPIEDYFVILKIEKIKLNDFAAKLISSLRMAPPASTSIKLLKDFQEKKDELSKNPPASLGIVYIKSKEGGKEEIEFGKNLLVQIFGQENCYIIDNKTILALVLNCISEDFQYNIIELYSKINHSEYKNLNIGSHWSNDDEEEISFLLNKAIYKLIN